MKRILIVGFFIMSILNLTHACRRFSEDHFYMKEFSERIPPNCLGNTEVRYLLRLNANTELDSIKTHLSKHFFDKKDSISFYKESSIDHYKRVDFRLFSNKLFKRRLYIGSIVADTMNEVVSLWSFESISTAEEKQSIPMTKHIYKILKIIYSESDDVGKQTLLCETRDAHQSLFSDRNIEFVKWLKRHENRIATFESDSLRTRRMLEREIRRIDPDLSYKIEHSQDSNKRVLILNAPQYTIDRLKNKMSDLKQIEIRLIEKTREENRSAGE